MGKNNDDDDDDDDDDDNEVPKRLFKIDQPCTF